MGLALAPGQVLDLFDDGMDPTGQLLRIGDFLSATAGTSRDLLLYYVGHGGFHRDEYYLGVQCTQHDREFITTIESRKLAEVIRRGFGRKRVYVILDSCFAASAAVDWQGNEIEAAVRKMAQPLPRQGTAFLAAASKYDVTRAPRAELYTVFTGAILEALRRGVDRTQQKMSMYELYEEVRDVLQRRETDAEGRPELHVPSQAEGDISRLRLFPNAAYLRAEAQRVRAERVAAEEVMAERARSEEAARARYEAAARAREEVAAQVQIEAVEPAAGSARDEVTARAHEVEATRTGIYGRPPILEVEATRTEIDVRLAGARSFMERRATIFLVAAASAIVIAIGVTIADRVALGLADRAASDALASDAERISAMFDATARSAHMRADGIATTPLLRAAIETDAAALDDLAATETIFTANQSEALEIFQFRADKAVSMLRNPKTVRALPPLEGRATRLRIEGQAVTMFASAPVSSYRAELTGSVVISVPVDLTPIRRALEAHAVRATLTGLGSELTLAGSGGFGDAPVKLAIPSGGEWTAGGATLLATPRKPAGLTWAAQVRNLSGGLGALLLMGFVVTIKRRGAENATPPASDDVDARMPIWRPARRPTVVSITLGFLCILGLVVGISQALCDAPASRTPDEPADPAASEDQGPTADSSGAPGGAGLAGSDANVAPKAELVETQISSSVEGATVQIVGTDQSGPAPFSAKLENRKPYKARIIARGFATIELDLRGGDDKQTAKLVAKPRVIAIDSAPPGALILIDSTATGHTTPFDVELTPAQAAKKTVRVQLRKSGFRTVGRVVELARFIEDDTRMAMKLDEKLTVQPSSIGSDRSSSPGPAPPVAGSTGSAGSAGSAGPAPEPEPEFTKRP